MNLQARKILSLAALATVAASAAVTGAASAATFGEPVVAGPGAGIPIDFAAFKEPADNRLPANYRIVKVHAEVARGEVASTVLTAPQGFKIVTIGIGDGHKIGASVKDTHYWGKRSVRVKVFTNNAAVRQGETANGTLYILARR
jgi:hypothetical protein